MGEADDRELWRRAVGGEPEAFGVLFDRHGKRIRSYCARRTGSVEAADDLVSVVFLEVWRRRADVELLGKARCPGSTASPTTPCSGGGGPAPGIGGRWRGSPRPRRARPTMPTTSPAGWTTNGSSSCSTRRCAGCGGPTKRS
jgi:hypothetical protein